MVLIAVDPHKSSHTVVAVDAGGQELGRLRVAARDRAQLLGWARQWQERRWAIARSRRPAVR
jgi:transposase